MGKYLVELTNMLTPIKRRIRLMVRRAIVNIIDDSTPRQLIQASVYQGETSDGIERFQNYGHTSVPPKSSEAILAALGGNLDQVIALCVEDKDKRPKDLVDGDNCFYHQDGHNLLLTIENGKKVAVLTVDILRIDASEQIDMNTKIMNIKATSALNIDTPKQTNTGDIFAADFSAGGFRYLGHKHKDAEQRPTTAPIS